MWGREMNAGLNGRAPLLASAQLLELSPTDIAIPERIGFLHEDKAAALGRLMAVDGQRDPIKVTKNTARNGGPQPWKLVTGMHRLMGATYECITVFAIEVKGKPEDLADLEASENLHRRPLGPIERAKFTAALVTAAQERIAREHGDLDQYQRGAKARWDRVRHLEEGAEGVLRDETEDACAKFAQAYGWEESVGEALGMSRRTIHNDLALYRLLIEPFPDLIYMLAQHPVVGENGSQLKELTRLKDEGVRRRVIEALLANSEIGVEDAKIAAGVGATVPLATPVAHQKFLNAVVGNLQRLGAPKIKQHLPEIVRALGTPDVKRKMRDLLNEELGE
jgi:ParB family transcriptional regulator, chromosome partitioning protein